MILSRRLFGAIGMRGDVNIGRDEVRKIGGKLDAPCRLGCRRTRSFGRSRETIRAQTNKSDRQVSEVIVRIARR